MLFFTLFAEYYVATAAELCVALVMTFSHVSYPGNDDSFYYISACCFDPQPGKRSTVFVSVMCTCQSQVRTTRCP